MTYPVLNGTQIGNDLTQIIVYVNSVTSGWFVPSILFSFFMIVLISSSVLQQRYSGNIKFEQAFAASCFATSGLAILLMMKIGLLNFGTYMFLIGLNILAIMWLYLGSD